MMNKYRLLRIRGFPSATTTIFGFYILLYAAEVNLVLGDNSTSTTNTSTSNSDPAESSGQLDLELLSLTNGSISDSDGELGSGELGTGVMQVETNDSSVIKGSVFTQPTPEAVNTTSPQFPIPTDRIDGANVSVENVTKRSGLTNAPHVNYTQTTVATDFHVSNFTKPGIITTTATLEINGTSPSVPSDIPRSNFSKPDIINTTSSLGINVTSPSAILTSAAMQSVTIASSGINTTQTPAIQTSPAQNMTTTSEVMVSDPTHLLNVTSTKTMPVRTYSATPEFIQNTTISHLTNTTSATVASTSTEEQTLNTTFSTTTHSNTTSAYLISSTTPYDEVSSSVSTDNLTISPVSPVTTAGLPPPSGPGAELWIIIVACVAGVLLIFIIILVACCIKRKQKDRARKMRYVGDDDDNIMDYAYHPRRPASPPSKTNGTTSHHSTKRVIPQENPAINTDEERGFDPTTKPAFRNYFQDGIRATADMGSSNETLNSANGDVNDVEFNHNSIIRRDKSFPLQPLDSKKARMSMGPIMLSGFGEGETDDTSSPSTQKTYDKMYTHSTFQR